MTRPGGITMQVQPAMMTQSMLDTWLTAHPYLKEVARFQQTVEAVLGNHEAPLPVLQWDDHVADFSQGMPLLRNRGLAQAVIDQASEPLARLVERMTETDSPDGVRSVCAPLREALLASPGATAGLIEQLISGPGDEGPPETQEMPGTIRYLGWMVLAGVLRPWVTSYERWAADTLWGRAYCPMCGAPPAMAQLARTQKGRERFLSCGCCRCRWSFQRTACPFCGNQDQEKLGVLELSQEEDLRLDICRECNGFLKTYTGEGEETLLLSDWSTIHLDVLAGQEGFQRRARSLYDL